VFFFLDPDIAEDASLSQTDTIILSYTFFESKDAQKLKLLEPANVSKLPAVKQEQIAQ
jgi:cytochrome c oxidase assembly protein Cox11